MDFDQTWYILIP